MAGIVAFGLRRGHSAGLWYLEVSDAIDYAQHRTRSHGAVIRVYDAAGNVIETHEDKGISQRAVTMTVYGFRDC